MGFWGEVGAATERAYQRQRADLAEWRATRKAGTRPPRRRAFGVLGLFGYRLRAFEVKSDRPAFIEYFVGWLYFFIPFFLLLIIRFGRRSGSRQIGGSGPGWGTALLIYVGVWVATGTGHHRLAAALGVIGFGVFIVYLWRTYVEPIPVEAERAPSKRLAELASAVRTGDDLTRLTAPVEVAELGAAREAAQGRVMLGSAFGALLSTSPQRSALLLGPARSGKTSTVLAPTVAGWKGPVIITTTKHDDEAIEAAVSASLWEGRPAFTFTPTEPDMPAPFFWSPLTMARKWGDARLVSREMTGAVTTARERSGENAYFLDRAEALLAALMHVAAVSGKDMETLVQWATSPPAPPTKAGRTPPVDWMIEVASFQDDIDPLAKLVLDGFKDSTADNRGLWAIWSTCARTVSGYLDARVLASTEAPEGWGWSIERWLREDGLLVIRASSRDQQLCVASITGLIGEAIATRYRLGPDAKPLLLALDEVANMAPLRDLHTVLSEGGSQGVTTLAVLQDLSQARHRFEIGDGIVSLANSVVVFPGIRDSATLQNLQQLAGNEYHRLQTRQTMSGTTIGRERSTSTQETVGETIQTLASMSAAEISRGHRRHAALFTSDVAPFFMRMHPISAEPFTHVARASEQPVRAVEIITGERAEGDAALSALS